MRHEQLKFGTGFQVMLGTSHAQVAQMTLRPGESEGSSDNRHRGADQWVYVVSGRGVARVNRSRIELRPGKVLLIERGDRHEIRCTGRTRLKTVNFYVPPAYTAEGDELPAGKP